MKEGKTKLAALVFVAPLLLGAQEKIELNTITRVAMKDGVIEVVGTKKPSFTTFTMTDPPRLVIDIAEAVFSGVPAQIPVGESGVSAIRTATYGSEAAAIARVLIGFDRKQETEIKADGTRLFVYVLGGRATPERPEDAAVSPERVDAGGVGVAEAELARAVKEREAKEAQAKAEKEALAQREAEREAERKAAKKAELERQAQEIADRAAAARVERERLEKEKAEKAAEEKAERERLARERAEKAAAEKAERERLTREKAEKAAAEKAERERLARERAEKAAAEKAEQERLAREKAEKVAAEKAAREAAARAEKERLAREKAEKAAAEKAERERLARAKAEKAAADKAERERLAREKAERVADEKAERERIAREKAERVAAERAERERIAREKAEKAAAEKAKRAEAARKEREERARQAAQAPQEPAETSAEELPPPREATPVVVSGRRKTLTFVGFQPLPDGARVYARTNEPARFRVSEADEKTVIVELENTRLGSNQRFLDTSFFGTAVLLVSPSAGAGQNVQIEIKLREKIRYQARQDGSEISILFQSPARR